MRGIHVQTLSEREGDRAIIKGRIRGRIVCLDGCMGESGNQFLDVSDALSAGDGRAEGIVIPNRMLE